MWLSWNKGKAIPKEENIWTKAKCAALFWPEMHEAKLLRVRSSLSQPDTYIGLIVVLDEQ